MTAPRRRLGPTRHDCIVLACFADAFERCGGDVGTWVSGGLRVLPMFAFAPPLSEFHDEVYARRFVVHFDWPAWQSEAEEIERDAVALARCDLMAVRRLITVHVRKERFCEGELGAWVACGRAARVLRRLHSLAA